MLEQRIRAADARLTESEVQAIARQAYDELLGRFCEQQRCSPQLVDTHAIANRAFADHYERCRERGGPAPLTDAEREVLVAKWGVRRVQELEAVIALEEQGHVFIKPRFIDARLRDMGIEPHDGHRRQVTAAMYEPYRDACQDADAIMRGYPPRSRYAQQPVYPPVWPSPVQPVWQTPTSPEPVSPSASPAQAASDAEAVDTSPDLYEIAQRAAEAKIADGEWSPKTGRQRRTLAKLFTLLMGELPVSSITQQHMATFMKKRRFINRKLSPRNEKEAKIILELVEAGERSNESIENAPSATTINRDVTGLSTLFEWAEGQGYSIDAGLKLKRLRIKKGARAKRARDERPPTSVEDLEKLFALPTFTGSLKHNGGKGAVVLKKRFTPGKTIVHDAFYWCPIMIHYLGCRREEICKLCACDFVLDARIPYVHIRENHNGKIKTAASDRRLPLHPELIRLGLVDYVREIAKRDCKALFPELRPTNSSESLGDQFYDLAWSHMRKRGGLSPESDIHGFRHGFNAKLRRERVSKEERADMMGHAGEGETDERYTLATRLEEMLENIEHLPNLTAHLKPAPLNMPIFRGVVPDVECEQTDPNGRWLGGASA